MPTITEIKQLCRLCLVKDKVNTSIFEDGDEIRGILHKISICLPVKITTEKHFPKRICDDCLGKLDTFYQFVNVCLDSNKQLMKWLEEAAVENMHTAENSQANQSHSTFTDGVEFKQEVVDIEDDLMPSVDNALDDLRVPTDAEFLLQQAGYDTFEIENANEMEESEPSPVVESKESRPKRKAALLKQVLSENNSEDEDDPDFAETKVAKIIMEKTYNFNNTTDRKEIYKMLLDDHNDEDDFLDDEDDDDTNSKDKVESKPDNLDTDEDDADDDIEETEANDKFFIGKDGTKWCKDPPIQKVRSRKQNLIRQLPRVIGTAKEAQTPLDAWNCIMSEDILSNIVECTNRYIEDIRSNFKRERDAKFIDIVELKAFIGLLYLAGVYKSNRQSLEDLWGSDGDGVEKFRLTMNIKRFRFIIRCLRFDDKNTRIERRKVDKLAEVREIFTIFVQNCQKSYSLGEKVTIDEKLEGFRGRCSFRQYIPSKPNKYGIKIYALVDSQVFYFYNLEIEPGVQPEGLYRTSNKPLDVVMRLCQPIFQSGRNITADNCFTSISLIEELRKKNLFYVGTIRRNKPEIPTKFSSSKGRAIHSSLFGFKKGCQLVSYIPTKGKCVLLASSMHENKSIDPDTGDLQKPEVLTYYNSIKGGVDTTDKLCESYNVARNVRRWPMVIFFAMLNISSINAQIIFFGNGQNIIRRRLFLKQLSHALILPYIVQRSASTSKFPQDLHLRLKHYKAADEEPTTEEKPRRIKRKRCDVCLDKRRLTKYNCKKCNKSVCLMHLENFCPSCTADLLQNASYNIADCDVKYENLM